MTQKKYHRLLLRQLKKCQIEPGNNQIPKQFLNLIQQAYEDYDHDFRMQEVILEKSSLELFKAHKELERDLASLFKFSPFGIALIKNEKIFDANETFCELVDYSLDELKNLSISDISYVNSNEIIEGEIKSKTSFDIYSQERRYSRKNGSLFWASTQISPVYNRENELKYHLAIIQNIQQRKEAEQKEKLLIEELRHSNDELDAFAQMVSHDLKSPLRGINTLVDWLKTDKSNMLDEEGRNYLDEIELRAGKMVDLINGIMNYTRLNTDQNDIEEIDSAMVVDAVIKIIHRPHPVIFEKKGKFPILYADKHKIHQLFQNIIDNAAKHSDEQAGKVTITTSEDARFIIFKISDNGSGIPKKYHQKIFEMFTTLGHNSNTGIGLAIVKNIISQYGGKIYVESEEGKGATFTFSLSKNKILKNA